MDADHWQRMEKVLDIALATDPAEWPDLLTRECSGDAAFREEVEQFLARVDTARRFLSSPPAAAAAALVEEDGRVADGADRQIGRRIGAFRVVRLLGQGGMSRVFLAQRDDGAFEQTVALKLLRPGLDSALDLERIRSERQILASLNHPNIARLLDGGMTDDGHPYIVMEYVDGLPIDEFCRQRQLPSRDRIRLFLTITEAVQFAHRNLVVHRDLKPSNIFVSTDGTLKLLDFGLAKLQDDSAGDGGKTRTGHRWMTPEYAAPEQVRGLTVTTLTDVYQLGAVLYELLSSRTPFAGFTHSLHELETAILEREPPPLDGGQPADVNAIVAKALRKEPELRYPSAQEMAADIERYLGGLPVLARRHTTGYVARRFVRRHRMGLAATGAVAALLVTYVVETRRQRDEARDQRDRAVFAEKRATAASAFMQSLLTTIAPAGERLRTVDLLDRARVLLERDYSHDPGFVARMLLELSEHYGTFADLPRAENVLSRAAELARMAGDGDVVAETECRLVQFPGQRRDVAMARARVDRALQTLAAARDPGVWPRIECMLAQSGLAEHSQHPDSAIASGQRALSMAIAAGDTASVNYVGLLTSLSTRLGQSDRRREALEMTRRRVEALRRIGRVSGLPAVRARMDEAMGLMTLGELRAADSAFAALLPAAYQVDSTFAESFFDEPRATLFSFLGHFDSARLVLMRSRQSAAQAGHRERYRWALERLVRLEAEAGRRAAAQRHLNELDSLTPRRPVAALALARVAEADGMWSDALELYRARMSQSRSSGPRLVTEIRIPVMAAGAALAAGQARTADSLATFGIDMAHQIQQEDTRSADLGLANLIRAQARLAIGDTALAREFAMRAIPGLENGLGPEHSRVREARALLARLGTTDSRPPF